MANTTNRIAGTAFFTIDRTSYLARGDFSYSCALVTRESVGGIDGVHGYNEKPHVPFIEGTLTNSGGLDVRALNSLTDTTVQLQLANGKTVVGRDMWSIDSNDVGVDDGKVKFRVEGLQGAVTEN